MNDRIYFNFSIETILDGKESYVLQFTIPPKYYLLSHYTLTTSALPSRDNTNIVIESQSLNRSNRQRIFINMQFISILIYSTLRPTCILTTIYTVKQWSTGIGVSIYWRYISVLIGIRLPGISHRLTVAVKNERCTNHETYFQMTDW